MDLRAIRALVIDQAHFTLGSDSISDTTDLKDAGLTSVTRMNVILAIEEHYNIRFPDEMLTLDNFRSIRSISNTVKSLLSQCQVFLFFLVSSLLPGISYLA